MSNEFEKFISENREAFDERIPDPSVLGRIHAQMQTGAARKKAVVIPMKAIRWAAAACIVLVAGAAVFFLLPEKNATHPGSTAKTETAVDTPLIPHQPETAGTEPVLQEPDMIQQVAVHPKKYTTDIDAQMLAQKRVLFARLNNMQSPGQRITAAEQAYEFAGKKDRDIVDALVKTLDKDPNTNVRLAALEALSKFHREPYVKKQLTNALKTQKDPIVQIELIQMLTKMKQVSILQELEKIVDDDNTMKAVKDHAYAGILNLKS